MTMARNPCLKSGQPGAPQREALSQRKGVTVRAVPAANSGLKSPKKKK